MTPILLRENRAPATPRARNDVKRKGDGSLDITSRAPKGAAVSPTGVPGAEENSSSGALRTGPKETMLKGSWKISPAKKELVQTTDPSSAICPLAIGFGYLLLHFYWLLALAIGFAIM